MNPAIFTRFEPDPIGQMLGTRYCRFESRFSLDGLAKETQFGIGCYRLDLLAVASQDEGKGHFRRFIEACKKSYKTICIWHVDSLILQQCLPRYGFTPAVEIDGMTGDTLTGFRWDKTKEV